MDKRLKNELRVGLFFNLGIALILIVLFFFGGPSHFFSKKIRYRFTEDNAQGIVKGAKVEVAGVRAGTVDQVKLDPKTSKVTVDIEIEPHFRSFIREGSSVSMETQGVLGDKIVMVQPGSPEKPELPDQAVLPSHSVVGMNHLLAQGSSFIQHLDQLTTRINERLKDLDVEKIDLAVTNLNGILEKINNGSGSLGALVNDPELYDDAKNLVGQVNQNRIVRNLIRKSINDAQTEKAEQSG